MWKFWTKQIRDLDSNYGECFMVFRELLLDGRNRRKVASKILTEKFVPNKCGNSGRNKLGILTPIMESVSWCLENCFWMAVTEEKWLQKFSPRNLSQTNV